MATQLDVIWVPSATDIAITRVTAFAELAAHTYGYRSQTLNQQATSPRKISTTIASAAAAS
jgi:hypothetical protein